MGTILPWVIGSSGVLGLLTIVFSERYRAHRAEKVAQIAHRTELCTRLLTVQRDFFVALASLRSRHDNLKERWTFSDPAMKRKLDALPDAIKPISSELSLTPEGKKVQSATLEYLKAGEAYVQAMQKPMLPLLTGQFSKADAQELDRLSAEVSAKQVALENAATRYVHGSPSGLASWRRHLKQRKHGKT